MARYNVTVSYDSKESVVFSDLSSLACLALTLDVYTYDDVKLVTIERFNNTETTVDKEVS